jgi:hypothetical protein
LSEEGIKYLRKERSRIAKRLKERYYFKKLLRNSDRRRIVRESGGDVDKMFDKIGRKTKNVQGDVFPNNANPLVFEESINDILKRAQRDAAKAAEKARKM